MKGIYVLLIQVSKNVDLPIGRLGILSFRTGKYVYVGSAQKELEKRVDRHLRRRKRLFWHIDYLLHCPFVKVVRVLWKPPERCAECEIAKEIEAGSEEVITGFGCSDCRCRSHLFRIKDFDFLSKSMDTLVERKD